MGLPRKKQSQGLENEQQPEKLFMESSNFSQEKYASLSLPDFVCRKWNKVLNLLSELGQVKVSLITRWRVEANEIFSTNNNSKHPYKTGQHDPHSEDFYCETVIRSNAPLLVEDAANNPKWNDNPDLKKYNFGAYYGEPIFWPNKEVFGTLCYMNDQVTHFSESNIKLLSTYRESIEKDLQVYIQFMELYATRNDLQRLNKQLEKKVTERTKQIDETNRHLQHKNKELLKINHELDRFIYSASHGLKAPLTTLQGLIHLSQVEEDKEKFAGTYLELMEKSVVNLQNIIQNLSNYSLNARASLKLSSVNLYRLLTEIIDSLRFMPQMEHVRIETAVDKNFELYSDSGRLKIIFYNLLSNAIKFYDPDKADSFVRIGMKNLNSNVVIEFEDNGLGIPAGSHNKIFQLFYRATAVSEGPGMGLFIVKESLELLGGSISVTSEYSKGTTFKVTLPKGNENVRDTED